MLGIHRRASRKRVNHGHPVMALYGNVALERGYCPNCKSTSFIKNGNLVCCDIPVSDQPKKFHRETEAPQHRKTPPKAAKNRILEEQEDRCFYCGVWLESTRFRNGKPFTIKVNWDHQLPYAFSQNNATSNFVAACHVCNGIKSDRLFKTVEEAQLYLAQKRQQKGYDF
jgi:5-methylcytosine-specific restriction endonuclease McrA